MNKQIPAKLTDEHLRELRAHIEECYRDLIEEGETHAKAAVESLRRIGPDAIIADSLIRSYNRSHPINQWRATAVPLALTALFWPLQRGLVALQIPCETLMLFGITCLLLVSAGAASYRYQKVLIKPILIVFTIWPICFNVCNFNRIPAGVEPAVKKAAVLFQIQFFNVVEFAVLLLLVEVVAIGIARLRLGLLARAWRPQRFV